MNNQPPTPKQKLYCYVDESGQDTKGQLFLVSVVVSEQEYEAFCRALEQIEQTTKKGLLKWHKTAFERKVAYIKAIIAHPLFPETIFFSHYTQTQAYVDLTVYTTAKAIIQKARGDYKATVIVDGLSGTEVRRFAKGLRQLNIRVKKVRGARDEGNPGIRLADAIAGFVRDYLEGQAYAQALYQEAKARRVIREV